LLLKLEYSVGQYQTLIQKDPVKFSRVQVPLRESMQKMEKIETILSNHPDNPPTENDKLELKRYIIKNELMRAEGGLCMGCAYYLPNKLKSERGYMGMIKKMETLPENTPACNMTDIKLSQPTLSSCDMYIEDAHALRDDDLKELEDRIAAWNSLQVKYENLLVYSEDLQKE
jgi:cation transport regulator ChaC